MLLDSARFVPAAHLDICARRVFRHRSMAGSQRLFDRGRADHPSLLDSLPQRLPQCSFAGDAMRAKFALCPGLLSPTEPGKSGRYMNQEDGFPASFVHSIFLTYPRDRAYVAANRSLVASILGIIRAGRVPKQKTRLVPALWQMFQDI